MIVVASRCNAFDVIVDTICFVGLTIRDDFGGLVSIKLSYELIF